jgi:hypothetical protein
MRLISLLNHYQHFPGFVYERARHFAPSQTIEITVRPRRGSRPVCSGCHKPAPGYDHLSQRRFEFVPLWGCMVVLLYCMRRVDCRACGVRVEAVPWSPTSPTDLLTRLFLDRLQDSVAYGCVPERICFWPAGISPGERRGAFNRAAQH